MASFNVVLKSGCPVQIAGQGFRADVGSIASSQGSSLCSCPTRLSSYFSRNLVRETSAQNSGSTRRSRPKRGAQAAVAEQLGVRQALKYNKLGESDLTISEITLGTVSLRQTLKLSLSVLHAEMFACMKSAVCWVSLRCSRW